MAVDSEVGYMHIFQFHQRTFGPTTLRTNDPLDQRPFRLTTLIQIADHLAQFVSVDKQNITHKNTTYYKRDYKNFNQQSFLNNLSTQNWSNEILDPNVMFDEFILKLEGVTNRHAPLQRLNKKEVKLHNKPWITPVILKKIQHRNSIFSRKKDNPHNLYLKQAYNKFRNSINRDIKNSKVKYYSNYFENCKNNMKKTWKGINEIASTKLKSSSNINQIKANNVIIDDPKMISNAFNNFFVNVGPNIDKDIPISVLGPSTKSRK